MPHYRPRGDGGRLFHAALASLFAQTDDAWRLVIVDDASPEAAVRAELHALRARFSGRIHVLFNRRRLGPGPCRNRALRHAARHGAEIALFLDADDLAHPRRLAHTRAVFARKPQVDVVYAPFRPIDARGRVVPCAALRPSIRQILAAYAHPPVGRDLWRVMGTRTGYLNLTSATSVRMALALRQPFPAYAVSEDFHTWLRYAADGRAFHFAREIPAGYRVLRDLSGSQTRRRLGAAFYRRKIVVDGEGFEQAMRIALARGRMRAQELAELRRRFVRTQCRLLGEEGVSVEEVLRLLDVNIHNIENIQST